jgi:hypothetical protein
VEWRCAEVPPPPVFCKKSLQVIENKRREPKKEGQERKRVRNSMKRRELRMELREGHARLVRGNTGNDTIDSVYLSIVHCKFNGMRLGRVKSGGGRAGGH